MDAYGFDLGRWGSLVKIALVTPYDFSYPGGVTEHTAALAAGLQQRGHSVQILAAYSGYESRTPPGLRVVTRRVTTVPIAGTVARVGLSPLTYLTIRQILRAEAFDVIHLQEPLTPSITWFLLMQRAVLRQTITIGTFHAYHERPNWIYAHGRPLFGYFFARLDGLIAVSEAARQFARQMFPGEYQIIPNGVDLRRFGKKQQANRLLQTSPINILFVGRLDRRKGFGCLLDSFLRLKPIYPDLRLTVVGPFDPALCQPYRRLAAAQGVTDIDFVGYVPPEQLPAFYHQADIFCAPSLGFESFGIVLLEAMAAGLPVVASDIAGYRSVIHPGREGWLVPPGEPESLAAALRHLIDHPQQRRAMGRRGQQQAELYSWDGITEQILTFYRQTIERKRAAISRLETRPSLDTGGYRHSVGQSTPKWGE